MFAEEIKAIEEAAGKKLSYMESTPLGYLVLSALAGVYVGFGIVLIFAIGGPVFAAGNPLLKMIMGASFGIALSLVIFAGSELFTGNNMVLVVGRLKKNVTTPQMLKSWGLSFIGNWVGSIFLAWLVFQGDSLAESSKNLVVHVGGLKMNAGAKELFIRGILCNWLVCLAVWLSFKARTETAKLIMVFWCLFAFISSGFEHCVANMTLLSLSLFVSHGPEITVSGMMFNLTWVTLGNIVGGALFVGMAYWFAVSKKQESCSGQNEKNQAAALNEVSPRTPQSVPEGTVISTISGR